MQDSLITLSERGQLTLPKWMRDQLVTKRFIAHIEDGRRVVLEPLQTRDEFLNELEESYTDWKENGGLTLDKMAKKYGHEN